MGALATAVGAVSLAEGMTEFFKGGATEFRGAKLPNVGVIVGRVVAGCSKTSFGVFEIACGDARKSNIGVVD